MSANVVFFCLLILLQFCLTLGSEATCGPPPAIQCKSHECQIFNYQGIWDDRGNCSAANSAFPTSEGELLNAVAEAVKNGQHISVVSRLAHSQPKLVCVERQGLIISTQNYNSVVAINKTAMTITVQAGMMMSDVLEAAAEKGLAIPAMIYWNGVSAAGVISTGSHGSGLVGKGSGVYEYVVAMRIIVPASASEGYAKVISLTEADEDLKAARLSLGTLGAISEITFACEPMFKRSVTVIVKNDSNIENEAESFLRAHEFGDLNWVPSHGKAVYSIVDRVSVNEEGDGINEMTGTPVKAVDVEAEASYYEMIQAKVDIEAICNILQELEIDAVADGYGYLNDGKKFTGYPVIGFNNRMQTSGGCQQGKYSKTCTPTKILDKNESICTWDRRVHSVLYFDVQLAVPMSRLREVIKDIIKIRDLDPHRLCDWSGIFMRSIKKSEAYLGPVVDLVTLELKLYRSRESGTPKWNEDVFEEIEQIVIDKYGGRLHWGKSGGYLFEGLTKRVTNLEKFLEVKNRFDSLGVFSNEWTNGLFGIGGIKLEDFRDGCALDLICKCKEDRHCAPHKGYFCKPGRVWKNARVCRKYS